MSDLSHTDFRLDGMTCASCVGRAERALLAVPGVTEARVNLADRSARVAYGAPAGAEALAGALRRAGYPAVEERLVLEVDGMTCASCTGRVERVLAARPGAIAASANLALRRAELRRYAGGETAAEIAAALTAAGYPARPAREEGGSAPAGESRVEARRALVAAVLALPVVVLEMGGHMWPAFHHWVHETIGMGPSWWIQALLTAAILAGPGRAFFARGVPALLRGAPDMNSLVAIGTAAAFAFSMVATAAPGLLPDAARAVYFEAAAVIVTLVLAGRALEARARGRAGAAIARLIGLQPRSARVERGGAVVEAAIETIAPGDLVHVRPGETLAVDGEVTEGRSHVDESMISGEPAPVAKEPGAEVTGGTVNGPGPLVFRATRVGAETTLARIVRMVGEAQGAKLPIQALVDRITLYFVPAVIAVALATVAAWLAFGPPPTLTHALVAGVAVLIIACPCAMGLATPVSIMVGAGRAAGLGVLFRRGDALQALAEVRTVAFDKTGTLTEGRPELTDIECVGDEDTVLAAIAAVEARSEHPLAGAILRAAEARGLALPAAADFVTHTGEGAEAMVEGRRVLVGAARLMRREGVDLGPLEARGAALAATGRTPIHAAIDGEAAAVLGLADPIRPETREAMTLLRAMGFELAMITGDARATAEHVAAELGIGHVVAEVMPDGKVAALEALRKGGPVAFVGDGINDAPALATADVGVAIGTGADIAIEAAEVVLMSGDPRGVATAAGLSRKVMRNIRQNLFWAFAYNTALIPVAAGVLAPFGGPQLSPVLAAGAMALSSLFVLGNALRLHGLRAAHVSRAHGKGVGR